MRLYFNYMILCIWAQLLHLICYIVVHIMSRTKLLLNENTAHSTCFVMTLFFLTDLGFSCFYFSIKTVLF